MTNRHNASLLISLVLSESLVFLFFKTFDDIVYALGRLEHTIVELVNLAVDFILLVVIQSIVEQLVEHIDDFRNL